MLLLSQVPYAESKGLRVRSVRKVEGIVHSTDHDNTYQPDDIDGDITVIHWDSGNVSRQCHYLLNQIEVIQPSVSLGEKR